MSQDKKLQREVLEALRWEPSVNAAHIGVTADHGVVTLTGHVGTFAEKHAAGAAATLVKGVRAVAEEIEVRLSLETERDDADIAAKVADRLAWDVSVPRNAVKVEVEKGWVALSGEVDWFFQRDAAEQDVRRLFGVIGVSNQITIKPTVDVVNISDDIMHAMHRSWFFDPATITVSAEFGKVRLSGEVHTPYDRRLAATTAWSAAGVTDVENNIMVI
ncbi:BON domain-containing protein [Beijerinckia sp. L45]|uniref:BON domain-containing protein n=1 Tax=Beijerinckia sp. L45 TaxID=1641855 RepID=UPI00131CEA59|nr:BON domain-containing protein [Beijerinckia sp. L45]